MTPLKTRAVVARAGNAMENPAAATQFVAVRYARSMAVKRRRYCEKPRRAGILIKNLANMRAIVRRVYQGDYTARPDPPEINRVPNHAYDPPPVIPPPATRRRAARSATGFHAERTYAYARPDLPDPPTATPTEPPSAPGLQTLEDAVTSARVGRVTASALSSAKAQVEGRRGLASWRRLNAEPTVSAV